MPEPRTLYVQCLGSQSLSNDVLKMSSKFSAIALPTFGAHMYPKPQAMNPEPHFAEK